MGSQMILYVIRHGETLANRNGVLQGQMDVPLSDTGRRQAELVAQALSEVSFDVLYSSDLSRARETAEAIVKYQTCKVVFDRRLRELAMGRLEGLTRREVADQYPDFWEAFQKDPVHTRRPGGESWLELNERVGCALRDMCEWNLARAAASVAVVSHGGAINGILRAAGVDSGSVQGTVGNCTVTVLERNDGVWSLVRIDDGEHLKTLI